MGRVHAQLVQRRLGRVSHGVVSVFFFPKNPFSMLSSSFMRPDFTPVESSRSSDKELRVHPRSYLKTYGERAFSFNLLPQNRLWNTLLSSIKRCKAAESFKSTFKTYLFRDYFELQESLIITFFQAFLWYLVFFIIHCCKALLVQ